MAAGNTLDVGQLRKLAQDLGVGVQHLSQLQPHRLAVQQEAKPVAGVVEVALGEVLEMHLVVVAQYAGQES